MKKVLKLLQLGILCAISILLSTCATREEGCNDALANNFDLGADKPCDGCCEYPGVRIRLSHKYGNTPMAYNQTIFTDGAGNTFGFGDLRFYLSNIQLLSVGNKIIDVQEPLDVYLEKAAGDTVKTTTLDSGVDGPHAMITGNMEERVSTIRHHFQRVACQALIMLEEPRHRSSGQEGLGQL